jgi:hypothetical protein
MSDIKIGKSYKTSNHTQGWVEKPAGVGGKYLVGVVRWSLIEIPAGTPLIALSRKSLSANRSRRRAATAEFITPFGRCWIPINVLEAN